MEKHESWWIGLHRDEFYASLKNRLFSDTDIEGSKTIHFHDRDPLSTAEERSEQGRRGARARWGTKH